MKAAAWAILAFGALLRIARYIHFRSLWLDEIYLAKSLLTRNYHDLLFKPLENWQAAPAGFLVLERFAISLFGPGEHALRLMSLAFGLASLPLFLAVVKRVLQPRAVLLALAMFTTLGPLIYYSNELKQYSLDVFFSLAIALALMCYLEKPTARRAIAAAAVGFSAVFFSHPAVFVLAGSGIAGLWVLRDRRNEFLRLARVAVIWAIGFAINYLLFIHPLTIGEAHPKLVYYWRQQDAFMPISPLAILPWLFDRIWRVCQEPGAMWLSYPDAAMTALIVGVVLAFHQRQNGKLLILLSPLPIVLAASAIYQYPFGDRLVLFMVPALLITISAGIDALCSSLPGTVAAAVLGGMILIPSACRATGYLMDPPGREETLSAYQWVARHWQAGDILYLSHFASESYNHYKAGAGWGPNYPTGSSLWIQPEFDENKRGIFDDVARFAGRPRVWVVLIHDYDTRMYTITAFNRIGQPQPALGLYEPGAETFFYDCTIAPPPPKGR